MTKPTFEELLKTYKETTSALLEQMKTMSPQQCEQALNEIIPQTLDFFQTTGKDDLHNHGYRNRFLHPIAQAADGRRQGLHGVDRTSSNWEFKTRTGTSRIITPQTSVGEIDKIHLKETDPIYRNSKLLCGLFMKGKAGKGPAFVVSLNADDLSKYIDDVLVPAAAAFRTATQNMTQKKRDTLSIKVKDLMKYDSFCVEEWKPDLVNCEAEILEAIKDKKQKQHMMALWDATVGKIT